MGRGGLKSVPAFLMVTKLFQILLLLSPICIGSNVNMNMFDIIFFRTGVIALFTASLLDKPKRVMSAQVNNVIAGLLGLSLINIFIHTFNPMVMACMMNLFIAILGIYIIYTYYDDKQNLTKYILCAATINLVFFVIQRTGYDPIHNLKPYAGEEGALLGNKQTMMTYFALVVPFISSYLGLIGCAILGLWTRQYIIFIPIFIVLLYKLKGVRTKILFTILFILFCLWVRDSIWQSFVYRFNYSWGAALRIFFEKPLIGMGVGVRPIPEIDILGSSLLQFIFGLGVMSLVWIGYAVRKLKTVTPVIISLIAVMFVEYPLEIPRVWFLIMAIIVTYLLTLKGANDESSLQRARSGSID